MPSTVVDGWETANVTGLGCEADRVHARLFRAREVTTQDTEGPMKRSSTLLFVPALFLAGTACGSGAEPTGPAPSEPVATVAQPVTAAAIASGAYSVIKSLYGEIAWFNCHAAGYCPPTDVEIAAESVVASVESFVVQGEVSTDYGNLYSVLDQSARIFGDPSAAGAGTEQDLLTNTETLFNHLAQTILREDPTNQASVDEAYQLSPVFNMTAAFLDHLARVELVRQQAPITYDVLNGYRTTTLQVDEALVGSEAAWYQCAGYGSPQMINTVQSYDLTLPVKILWKKFADYRFTASTFSNNCNVFNHVTGSRICQHDCSNDTWGLGICQAGANLPDDPVYTSEVPKILQKMNRDPVVATVRGAMESLVGLAATNGAGLLWRLPSGELDLWNIWSDHSFNSFTLASPDPNFWQPIGTGDFNGDGIGDVLWLGGGTDLSIWEMANSQVTTMTPVTGNAPAAERAFIGDLDGDGISDVVWRLPYDSSLGYQTVTWLMTSGSTVPRSSTVSSSPTDQVQGTGNFDNDANHQSDVLYRNPSTGDVSIAFNGGPETPIGWAPGDWQIAGVGDFNGDGYSDILWYNVTYGYVAVWAMQGASIIANVGPGGADPSTGWSIQGVADIDHDGISDIVWRLAPTGEVAFWLMGGPGSVKKYSSALATSPGSTFAGVISLGPSLPANPAAPPIGETFCGSRGGTLRNPGFGDYEQWSSSTFYGGHGTLMGDVNGDGTADLVTLGSSSVTIMPALSSAVTFQQPGTGSFGSVQTAWPGPFYGSHGTAIGDIDGDGRADLVAFGDGYVGAIRTGDNNSYNYFGNYETWWGGSFYGSHGTFLGDVDGDGKADAVGVGDGYIGVIRSTGGSFGGYETWFLDSAGSPGTANATLGTFLGDVNGDGRADVVLIGQNGVWVALSSGSSFWGFNQWYSTAVWGSVQTLLGDVTGDGAADLIAIDANSIRVKRSTGLLGIGEFGEPPANETWWGPFYGNLGTFVGDVDGNGKADLVAAGVGYVGVIRSQ